jgi:hypothetical protein
MIWEVTWIFCAILTSYFLLRVFLYFHLDKENGLNARLKFFLVALITALFSTVMNSLLEGIIGYVFKTEVIRTIVFIPLMVSTFMLWQYIKKYPTRFRDNSE